MASDDGVRFVRGTEDGFELSAPLPLCGRPLRVAAVGRDAWAVATTLGLALIGGGFDVPLRVLSMSVLDPNAPLEALALLDSSQSGMQFCQAADHPPGLPDVVADATAIATGGGTRLLVASGNSLFDIDAHNTDAPVLRSVLKLKTPLSTLRVDERSGLAYAVGKSANDRPLFGLVGDSLTNAGTHDLAGWASRRDSGTLRLRLAPGKMELARVAR